MRTCLALPARIARAARYGAVAAHAVQAETAERIAACVNACAGIPTLELQAGILEDLLTACDKVIEPRLRAILDRLRRR